MMRRKVLQAAVAGTLIELGFDCADPLALDTLTEILQSYIVELGSYARGLCELAGRTEPIFGDVILALVNMGFDISTLEKFANRDRKCIVPTPVNSTQPKQLNILQAGVKQAHPSHIPTHLPPFPDPHAYIRTPTHKQPVTEYEAIREKAACQKRDIERALNRFIAKTGDTDSLFISNDNMFPLIACKAQYPTYMAALCPKDQIFEFEDEEPAQSPQRKRKAPPGSGTTQPASSAPSNGASTENPSNDNVTDGNEKTEDSLQPQDQEDRTNDEADSNKIDGDGIDNPYLRPVKIPIKIKIKDLLNA